MSFNKDLMNDGYFETVDSIMIGCIIIAFEIMIGITNGSTSEETRFRGKTRKFG